MDVSESKPGAVPARGMDDDLVDAYKRAAPHLLNELACLLSQHKWTEEGRIPHGLVNILNYSWQDLTAGAVHLRGPGQFDKRRKSKGSPNFDETLPLLSVKDKMKTEKRNSAVVRNAGSSERKTQIHSHLCTKRPISINAHKAHASTTINFSMSSQSCKEQGWIIQPKKPSSDEPQQIAMCQWVLEQLHKATTPIELQTAEQAEQGLDKPLILRHYGDAKLYLKGKRTRGKVWHAAVVDGLPQIPEVKQQDPAREKLHYRINDGSSIIYYPSGRVAVCQSHSGLPCGGFYTNVFSDSDCPVILASVTAIGHGTVTHPVSGAITAMWDQKGGFTCDSYGAVTKKWIWQTGPVLKEKTVIQLSDLISVRLFSGTSAVLRFRSENESVQLPISVLLNTTQPKQMPCQQIQEESTSAASQELLLAKKRNHAVVIQSKRDMGITSVSVHSGEVVQMVSEVEELEVPSVLWRGGGYASRELRRIHQRVRNILADWLDYYRMATGIKCPDMERMPDAPLRTRLRKEVQSAALPSLNPPEQADMNPGGPGEGRDELQDPPTHLSAPVDRTLNASLKLPRDLYVARTPKKRTKEEFHVTQIGHLRIRSNIILDSVIIPNSPELQPPAAVHCPVQSSFIPSVPLSLCPAMMRAALLEGEGRRLCCCSCRLMPLVTDLEYDAFITGQPANSEQILVVCVTPPHQSLVTPGQAALEQLYRKRNKNRTMPCTQCQRDSFRLVRYEMPTEKACCGVQNSLLQQRHNAAPGMALMYIRGKLLFVDYIFSGYSCSVRDFQKQISRTRGDYRLGLSLPPDYKFSDTKKISAAIDLPNAQEPHETLLGDCSGPTPSVGKTMPRERKMTQPPNASLLPQRATCKNAKKSPTAPPPPVVIH
ncbi:uncharacterized protein C3orf20 homolog [Myripristis murdjan]|uniref:uncharacterized protein C3orf20 homolog n=1 Tax=Myripristis murdjan TaxID=586833 RepID=UPI0011761541|nr:uncharacterized protein C3orf20 homolog [Myripristis murdjan]